MTALYDTHGIRFLYPENWSVVDDADASFASVESPEGAFWTVGRHPVVVDPASLNQAALETMRSEEDYSEFEFSAVEDEWGGLPAIGYDAFFCCLDLIVAARMRSFRHNGHTFFILCQGESRDFDRLEPVFNAMTVSLVQSEGENASAGG